MDPASDNGGPTRHYREITTIAIRPLSIIVVMPAIRYRVSTKQETVSVACKNPTGIRSMNDRL